MNSHQPYSWYMLYNILPHEVANIEKYRNSEKKSEKGGDKFFIFLEVQSTYENKHMVGDTWLKVKTFLKELLRIIYP